MMHGTNIRPHPIPLPCTTPHTRTANARALAVKAKSGRVDLTSDDKMVLVKKQIAVSNNERLAQLRVILELMASGTLLATNSDELTAAQRTVVEATRVGEVQVMGIYRAKPKSTGEAQVLPFKHKIIV